MPGKKAPEETRGGPVLSALCRGVGVWSAMQKGTDLKTLLVFAHRGEAQAFLKHDSFQRREFYFENLYESGDALLLITGEGAQAAAEKTAAVCGAFRKELEGVVNLGVAGSLDTRCQKGDIYSIRTVYRQAGTNIVFKSFTTADAGARIDCISADERVLTREDAAALAPFAHVVDRELWSIASVCRLLDLPLYAYKVVSDVPGQEDGCAEAVSRAEEFSQQLWRHFEASGHLSAPALVRRPACELPPDFHVTASQRRQFQNFLHALALKWQLSEPEVLTRLSLEEIIAAESIPKKRTVRLLRHMQSLLNPFRTDLQQQLETLCRPLSAAGCQVTFARDYESDEIQIQAKIGHPRHVDQIKAALEQFDYAAVVRVLNGELTVNIQLEKNERHVS